MNFMDIFILKSVFEFVCHYFILSWHSNLLWSFIFVVTLMGHGREGTFDHSCTLAYREGGRVKISHYFAYVICEWTLTRSTRGAETRYVLCCVEFQCVHREFKAPQTRGTQSFLCIYTLTDPFSKNIEKKKD